MVKKIGRNTQPKMMTFLATMMTIGSKKKIILSTKSSINTGMNKTQL